MGASTVPFGDLSVKEEFSDDSVAAFRCSNDIFFFGSVFCCCFFTICLPLFCSVLSLKRKNKTLGKSQSILRLRMVEGREGHTNILVPKC